MRDRDVQPEVRETRVTFHGAGVVGLLITAALLFIAWFLLSAFLSITIGQVLLLVIAGIVGFAIGRAT